MAGKVLVIAGPTASGKSDLGLAFARALEGVIINADAMQIYRDLEILTARPSAQTMAELPHRLYGVLAAEEIGSAARWRALAIEEIEKARGSGRQPILVGGTGLYIKALREGLTPLPPVPAGVRAAATAHFEALGGPAFHAALARKDPETAATLHPNDRQRLIRAWEVLETSGKGLAAWHATEADGDRGASPFRFETLVLFPPRPECYARCDRRFLQMIEAGGLEEVRRLLALNLRADLPVMKSLGVPELSAHLRGEVTLAAAIESAQTKTRRYAKRQYTWLRHQVLSNDAKHTTVYEKFSESFPEEIFNKVRQKILTP